MKDVQLPEIAENVEEGTVTGVLVSEGDTVEADQNILELETDKASVEVPAPFGGTVGEILVSEGQDVSVGDVIMRFKESDDPESEQPQESDESEGADDSEEPEKKESSPAGTEKDEAPKKRQRSEKSSTADVPASPATRRMAREIGVDLEDVTGTGPGGRISAQDVKDTARESDSGGRREQMTRVRSLTAQRTQTAWREIPHVTQFDEADLAQLNEYMEQAAEKVAKRGGKLTVTAVLVKLCAHALRAFPRFNASIDMESSEIVYHERVAIGVAADTDRGLLVPVLSDPDHKDIVTIALELGELAAAARAGELEVSQMQGGTFSLSNLGGIGGTAFTPVVVQPQVAILGVARASIKPVYHSNRFEPREILPLALSYDHRAIDGADGARFVSWIRTAIEDPFSAFMYGGAS